jgi:hypothetical protein
MLHGGAQRCACTADLQVWVVPSLEWSSDSTGGALLEWAVPEATPPSEGRLPKRRAHCLLSKGAMHPFVERGVQSMESALELASDVTRWMDATQPFEVRICTYAAFCLSLPLLKGRDPPIAQRG